MPESDAWSVYCFTETIRLVGTDSPGRPPRLSHSLLSWRSNSADVFGFCSRRFSSLWAFIVNVLGVQDMV